MAAVPVHGNDDLDPAYYYVFIYLCLFDLFGKWVPPASTKRYILYYTGAGLQVDCYSAI